MMPRTPDSLLNARLLNATYNGERVRVNEIDFENGHARITFLFSGDTAVVPARLLTRPMAVEYHGSGE